MVLLEQDVGMVIITSMITGLGFGLLPSSLILGLITIVFGFLGLAWIIGVINQRKPTYIEVEKND